MEKIDTGDRKVFAQCDLFEIMADRPHYRTFKGSGAQEQAEVFLRTRNLQKRGYIEPVLVMPRIAVAVLPPPDPDEELARIAGKLTAALKAKQGKDSVILRRKLFALQRVLAGRLA